MTLFNIERTVDALLLKHETRGVCEYIEHTDRGDRWFSCKCGASGHISLTPEQDWIAHALSVQDVLLPKLRRIQAILKE